MKIKNIKHTPDKYEKLAKDKWRVAEDIIITITTHKDGVIRYKIKKGFEFDMRSGSSLIDSFLPNVANEDYDLSIVWLIHDSNYSCKKFSKSFSDDLMYKMLRYQGVSKWRSYLAYMSVKYGGKEGWDKPGQPTLIQLTWSDK